MAPGRGALPSPALARRAATPRREDSVFGEGPSEPGDRPGRWPGTAGRAPRTGPGQRGGPRGLCTRRGHRRGTDVRLSGRTFIYLFSKVAVYEKNKSSTSLLFSSPSNRSNFTEKKHRGTTKVPPEAQSVHPAPSRGGGRGGGGAGKPRGRAGGRRTGRRLRRSGACVKGRRFGATEAPDLVGRIRVPRGRRVSGPRHPRPSACGPGRRPEAAVQVPSLKSGGSRVAGLL